VLDGICILDLLYMNERAKLDLLSS
jgi:hypothetical protein